MLALWPLLWLSLELCSLSVGELTTTLAYDVPGMTLPKEEQDGCLCGKESDSWIVCRGSRTCNRIPHNNIDTKQLRVTSTMIIIIYEGDLLPFKHLTDLKIEDNPKLTTIQPGAFNGLGAVCTLSISRNTNLKTLVKGAFKGLHNLTTLELIKNGFINFGEIVKTLTPHDLPSLLNISVSQNQLTKIESNDLTPLNESRLIDLRLRLCQLDYIHPEALKPLRYLRNLQLGENPSLNTTVLRDLINQLARDNVTLDFLDLRYMGFQEPPKDVLEAIGEARVVSLDLQGNLFQNLARGSFPRMPKLEYLNLIHCLISSVEPGVFDPSLMPQLEVLGLASNILTGLSPGVLPPQIKVIDFTMNSYYHIHPITFNLGEGNFVNMSHLSNLNISYVTLDIIRTKTFQGLQNLDSVLGLKNASITSIEPGSFRDLGNLTFLSLENNPFPAVSGMDSRIFEGLVSLEILILVGCSISNISDPDVFSALVKLEYLMLDENDIRTLTPNLFTPLTNLIGLSLSKNKIEPWINQSLFTDNTNLSKLFLQDNRLTYLSIAMLDDFSQLTTLQLANNLFICDCHAFYTARAWLDVNNFSIGNVIAIGDKPQCYSPNSWKNRDIVDFYNDSHNECFLYDDYDVYIWVGAILGVILLLAAVCGVLGYKYRSYFRYWAFLARMDLRRRGVSRYMGKKKRSVKGYTNYQYDAFVSYSSEDRNFVVRLVAMLENYEPFLKLCVYERDFEIGTVITEAVLESVATSRRTLLIVSDAFAKSQWCMWELRMAQHQRLFFEDDDNICGRRDDPLVMVKLGNIRDLNMTPTLKYLMRTRIYLEWDQEPKKQRIFWQKLRATLAPPNIAIKTTTN